MAGVAREEVGHQAALVKQDGSGGAPRRRRTCPAAVGDQIDGSELEAEQDLRSSAGIPGPRAEVLLRGITYALHPTCSKLVCPNSIQYV